MTNKYDKYLPLGTVVLLKQSDKKLMITGFLGTDKENLKEIYDYIGCLYPEGMLESGKSLLFNHNQIDKIYHFGYSDNEEKEFKKILNNS